MLELRTNILGSLESLYPSQTLVAQPTNALNTFSCSCLSFLSPSLLTAKSKASSTLPLILEASMFASLPKFVPFVLNQIHTFTVDTAVAKIQLLLIISISQVSAYIPAGSCEQVRPSFAFFTFRAGGGSGHETRVRGELRRSYLNTLPL